MPTNDTLAEEIRALLKMHDEESPQPRGKCFMKFWCAFPALAARMLAVIAERDAFHAALVELTGIHDRGFVRDRARIDELEKAVASYKTIADANEWTMNLQIDKLNSEISRLRWEASLPKEQPGC